MKVSNIDQFSGEMQYFNIRINETTLRFHQFFLTCDIPDWLSPKDVIFLPLQTLLTLKAQIGSRVCIEISDGEYSSSCCLMFGGLTVETLHALGSVVAESRCIGLPQIDAHSMHSHRRSGVCLESISLRTLDEYIAACESEGRIIPLLLS